jgi:hypothetical protein
MTSSSSTKASDFVTLQPSLYFQENYLPNYYEQDIQAPTSFRSKSPKQNSYNQEFDDDCEALYEATLMNSDFFSSIQETRSFVDLPLDRLRQILAHINPNNYQFTSTLCQLLEKKPRSQSLKQSDLKDKGIPKPTL